MLLRYLADNVDYGDYIRGIKKLSPDQMLVLFEYLKAKVENNRSIQVQEQAEAIEKTKEPIKIVRSLGDKPHSPISCCLHCGSVAIKKHGTTRGGVQRFICKDCKKTFAENYGLITHYTHLAEWQWLEIIRATIDGLSLTDIAKNLKISTSTAWACRMKVYQSLQYIYGHCDTFNNITEVDGKYERISFKGLKNREYFINKLGRLPRHHRSKRDRMKYLGSDFKRLFTTKPWLLKEMLLHGQKKMLGRDTIDLNHQHVCILTAIDRANNIYIEAVTSGVPKKGDVIKKLTGKFTDDAFIVTDEHHSYKDFTRKNHLQHIIIESGKHIKGSFSLSRVNSLHSSLDRFFKCKEYRPATKYLDLYLIMFWWLEKNKDISNLDMVTKLFAIMTGSVSNESRANLKRVTIKDLTARELPIDTKGFY